MGPTDQPKFQFDEQQIQTIINAIPSDEKRRFPAHILEPARIEIARELFLKEQFKLYPGLKPTDFDHMSLDILRWLRGSGYELAPIVDFWNYIDGTLLTLKLKDVVPSITSAHISWALERLDPKKVTFSAAVGTIGQLDQPSYGYELINQRILQNAQQMTINRQISDQKSNDTVVNRDHYPVLVRREQDGSLHLLDGNRRTLRALLYGHTGIDAWVGTVQDTPRLHDHWVSTGIMRRLLSQYENDPSPEVRDSIRSQLKIILTSSSIARINFKERCASHYPFATELAREWIDL